MGSMILVRRGFNLLLLLMGALVMLLHFFLAKQQLEHDGDNLFFVPVSLGVLSVLSYFSASFLARKKHILLNGLVCLLCMSVAIYMCIASVELGYFSFLLSSPIPLALLAGFLGSKTSQTPQARVH